MDTRAVRNSRISCRNANKEARVPSGSVVVVGDKLRVAVQPVVVVGTCELVLVLGLVLGLGVALVGGLDGNVVGAADGLAGKTLARTSPTLTASSGTDAVSNTATPPDRAWDTNSVAKDPLETAVAKSFATLSQTCWVAAIASAQFPPLQLIRNIVARKPSRTGASSLSSNNENNARTPQVVVVAVGTGTSLTSVTVTSEAPL